ncbi:MAG TPA: hypothetical protein VMT20_28420, partial [Terriglobia bacterium]|nr:hypothetical protein [Terriglobia bacterium]
HSREGGNPLQKSLERGKWIPAFAGMTRFGGFPPSREWLRSMDSRLRGNDGASEGSAQRMTQVPSVWFRLAEPQILPFTLLTKSLHPRYIG